MEGSLKILWAAKHLAGREKSLSDLFIFLIILSV